MRNYVYKNYEYFGNLCKVPEPVLDNLKSYYQTLQSQKPDIDSPHYKAWVIQKTNMKETHIDITWTHWQDNNFLDITKNFFKQFVLNIRKFKFSYLEKNNVINYHPPHMLPRIHVPLNDSGSKVYIKVNNVEHAYDLEYGSAHFINTTLQHKIVASEHVDRETCFFCFTHFNNDKLKEKFIKTMPS